MTGIMQLKMLYLKIINYTLSSTMEAPLQQPPWKYVNFIKLILLNLLNKGKEHLDSLISQMGNLGKKMCRVWGPQLVTGLFQDGS